VILILLHASCRQKFFPLERNDKTGVSGQFINKRTVDQTVTLPSGEEFTQEVAIIDVTKFEINLNSSNFLLNIFDAPRSLTSFFSAFSAATNFTCTIDPIEIDIDKWVHYIDEDKSAVAVIYLDITGIIISGEVQARLALSGIVDVYRQMYEFLGGDKKGTIESAKIRFHFDGIFYVLELGRRATLKVPVGFPLHGIDVLRKAMLLAQEK